MNLNSALTLLILAALWGGSFLFIRVGVVDFGPIPLMAMRVSIAALFLLVVLAFKGGYRGFTKHAWPLLAVGILNSAVPFCLFAFAEQTLAAGLTSVINATTPLWGALIAYAWMGERLTRSRVAGLALGFAGVLLLVWKQVALPPIGVTVATPLHSALAAAAALGATLCYGIAANYAKRALSGVPPLLVATGSMTGAALVLLPLAYFAWPAAQISAPAWWSVITMGIACTGVAYVMYFWLLAHAGPAFAMSVTFLVPIFGILWGALFLGEHLSLALAGGVVLVLAGTGLATGLLQKAWPARPPTLFGK